MKALTSFEYSMQLDAEHPILTDHRVHGERILPGVTFLDMIAKLLHGEGVNSTDYYLDRILFRAPIQLSPGQSCTVKVNYNSDDKCIVVSSGQSETWVEHCRCILQMKTLPPAGPFSITELKRAASNSVDLRQVYQQAKQLNIHHGPFMQGEGTAYIGDGYVLADIRLSEIAQQSMHDYFAHPALMDSMTVVPFAAGLAGGVSSHPYIPIAIDKFNLSQPLGDRVCVLAKIAQEGSASDDVLHNHIWLLSPEGDVIGQFVRLTAKRIRSAASIQKSAVVSSGFAADKTVQPMNLRAILASLVATQLNLSPTAIGADKLFYELGLDSSALLELVTKLEQYFHCTFYPTMLFEYNTLRAVEAYLQGLIEAGTLAIATASESPESITATNADNSESVVSAQSIRKFIFDSISSRLGRDGALDEHAGFYDLGLDSNQLLAIVVDIEQAFAVQLYPTLLFEYSTIAQLATYIGTLPINKTDVVQNVHTDVVVAPTSNDIATSGSVEGVARGIFSYTWHTQPLPENTAITKGAYLLWGDAARARGMSQILNEHCHVLLEDMLFFSADFADKLSTAIAAQVNLAGLIWCVPTAAYDETLSMALAIAQVAIKSGKPLNIFVIAQEGNPAGYALNGFWRSLGHEVNRINIRQIFTAEPGKLPLQTELDNAPNGIEIVNYQAGDRQRQRLESVVADECQLPPSFNAATTGGAVVISGGFGGIALACVRHLFTRGFSAFALIGRSEPAAHVQQELDSLRSAGAEILCLQANVADFPQLQTAWRKIKNRFVDVCGVIHTAGVLRDALVKDKTAAQAGAVLAGKVTGADNLDLLSSTEPLSFFINCGSIAGALGNLGQSDYAFANAALEAFSLRRQKMVQRGERSGRSLTVHWPLWRDGGMSLDETRNAQLRSLTGLEQMTEVEAMRCFDWLLFSHQVNAPAYLPVVGDMIQFKRHLSQRGFMDDGVKAVEGASAPARLDPPLANTPLALDDPYQDAIAIIGLAGIYPQAASIEMFWQNIVEGVDTITEVPLSRWNHDALTSESGLGVYSRWGGFIEHAARFDAEFFGITPREAELMDPQERLFLQTAWNTFEDAGIPLNQLPDSSVGVFVGAMWSQYQLLTAGLGEERKTSSIFSAIANRVSYSLNLKGPSMALDTMCSSALSALHVALESVRRGDCAMALVGGVNIMSHPHKYQFLCQNKMLSTDGRCRSFGDQGSGYVPGEGVGAILIKPLAAARRDGDNIHAVIRGSALSHGGKVTGMTVPHPAAQAAVIQKALDNSGVNANDISLIEAHGTGTSLGDPIELDGLKKVFGRNEKAISLGSIKSNIGHLESAAGIAALSKVILQLKNRLWVPSLHSEVLNPKLRFEDTTIRVQQSVEPWVEDGRRLAGISAFGAGGSNAHVVVEEFKVVERASFDAPVLIPISARDAATLKRYAQTWLEYLEGQRALASDARLVDIAYTAQTGRDAMEHRLVLVCSTQNEAIEQLRAFLQGDDLFDLWQASTQVAALVVLARDYMAGRYITWPSLADAAPVRVSIPVYPFHGPAYWYPQTAVAPTPVAAQSELDHALLQHVLPRVDGAHFGTQVTSTLPLVAHHQINNRYLLPGAASLTMMVDAVRAMGSGYPLRVEQFTLAAPVDVSEQAINVTTAVYAGLTPDTLLCELTSGDEVKTVHAQACILSCITAPLAFASVPVDWQPADDLYRQFSAKQFAYGPLFQRIEACTPERDDRVWVKLRSLGDVDPVAATVLAIDAAMQASVLLQNDISLDDQSYLPYQLNSVTCGGELAQASYLAVTRREGAVSERHFSLDIYDANGQCLWRAEQFILRTVVSASAIPRTAAVTAIPEVPGVDDGESTAESLRKAVKNLLVEALVAQTGLNSRAISKANTFDQVGIDSIAIMNITARLEEITGGLPKTLFFECPSVSALGDYLIANHRESFISHFGTAKATVTSASAPVNTPSISAVIPKALVSFAHQRKPGSHPVAGISRGPGQQPIAIIGLAGRYPDAETPEQLWQNLSSGRDSVISVPAERWDVERYFNADKNHHHTTYCRHGGFIEKAEYFDPAFFNITPADAIVSDPQERLFLQTAWHALEDAGYSREHISGKAVGVFAAVMWNQYQLYGLDRVLAGDQAGALSVASAIANRLSYTMNIQGPSLTLDTMCSSSLTALHLAAQAIWNGDCETAFVGGVNLSLHPHKYLSLCSNNFLSARGRCSAFGETADGYVPAEGVGVVYIKPLAQAEADGDHIYGVIRATAINHVGRTSGATVPSPDAQAALIRNALQQADIDPHSISYIEAHGTGTALGDPIEIRGLNKALNTEGRHPGCRIGSIKSNIGHAESAAGMASLTKVLMQMRHGQIAPSLHAFPLNPNIEFADTPFAVNQALCSWDIPEGNPRRAGISSFGAGGSNAHVLVEEYRDQRLPTAKQSGHLLVLSARNKPQLVANATRLLAWMEANPDANLTEICFTLQVGRDAFDHRFAVEVDSLIHAVACLQQAIAGDFDGSIGSYRAHSCLDDETELFEDEDGQEYLERLLMKKRWAGLARLWCRGIAIDWTRCYDGFVRRIGLPGYAFAEQKLIFDIGLDNPLTAGGHLQNISDIYRQAYRSHLSSYHPYLADHQIGGRTLMPMAWLATLINTVAHQAAPDTVWQVTHLNLEQMVIVEGDNLELEVVIEFADEGRLDVTIYQINLIAGKRDETRIASAVINQRTEITDFVDRLGNSAPVSAESLYRQFATSGFCYGKNYRRVAQLSNNSSQARAVLADTNNKFIDLTDPAVIDAALQLTRLFTGEDSGAWFPKSLAGFWFDANAIATNVVVDKIGNHESELSFRLYWLDNSGNTVGYCDRFTLANERSTIHNPLLTRTGLAVNNGDGQLTLVGSQWVAMDTLAQEHRKVIDNDPAPVWVINPGPNWLIEDNNAHIIIRWGEGNRLLSDTEWQIQANEAGMQFLVDQLCGVTPTILLGTEEMIANEASFYWYLWHLVRHAMRASVNNLRLVVTSLGTQPQVMALHSWMHALSDERPGYQLRVASSDQPLTAAQWSQPLATTIKLTRYSRDHWQARGFRTLQPDAIRPVSLKGQTVLVTGGAGGLGSLFARHLATRHGCNLALVGRKAINDEIRQLLTELRACNVEAVYYPASIGNTESMAALARKVKLRFGELHGVVHAAGFNHDDFILRQQADQVAQVLAPKVEGTAQLIDLLQELAAGQEQPWLLGFSSISGFLGHAGQADYSFANACMDEILLAAEGIRGITINWPLWDGVGMQLSQDMVQILESQTGMKPLPTVRGVELFDRLLAADEQQVLPLYGTSTAIKQWLGTLLPGEFISEANPSQEGSLAAEIIVETDLPTRSVHTAGQATAPITANGALNVEAEVKALVADVVARENGLAVDTIEWERGLDSYGFSSVAVSAMTHQLEKVLGELPKTLFFECRTLSLLVNYLADNHGNALAASAQNNILALSPVPQVIQRNSEQQSGVRQQQKSRLSRIASSKASVAIVGAAGRFPQADNLDELWQHLVDGKDCVTPIPQDRWRTGDTYDANLKGGFIRDIDKFDAKFFGISRNEATATDPHERLLLQSVWHSLEDAGIQPQKLAGQKVGVYVGAMWGQYQLQGLDAWRQGSADIAVSSYASIANRISYFFDFKGPSVTLDSMCSSSILALKFAVDALQNGEIDYAIVGGVNSSVHPYKYRQLKESMFLSSEGCCRAFGAGGDGYVPGEGIISLVLCRDTTANAGSIRIRAHVKGIAIAHGGNGNGYYVPNPDEQSAVIRQALDNANIDPQTISYVEAHGTGTALGDPIEVRGLQKSYFAEKKFPCAIGSIKANIGHLESAAGLASICKVLLQMEHDQLVPSIHSTPENPNIHFAATGLQVQRSVASWSTLAGLNPLRAGISSFGAGGTNAHVILEAPAEATHAKSPALPEDSEAPQLFVVSAKDAASLKQLVAFHSDLLAKSTLPLSHIATASQNLRQALETRCSFIAKNTRDLEQQIHRWLESPDYCRATLSAESFPVAARARLEDLHVAVEAWRAGKTLVHEAKFYCALPQYPFTKERFWVDTNGDFTVSRSIAHEAAVESKPSTTSTLTATQGEVKTIIAQLLGLDDDDIEEHTSFDTYGVDSVQANDIAVVLGKKFGVRISPTAFYNYPNLSALTNYLVAHIPATATDENTVAVARDSAQKELVTDSLVQNNDIAVIGMSGAFADAADVATLWKNLKAGVDSVSEVPASRWALEEFYDPMPGTAGKTYSRRMGLMDDVDKFDPAFFGLMPEEVIAMDPQQRLFLLHAFRAIEDAGINRDALNGTRTGVFCGAMAIGYRELLPESEKFSAFSMLGNHNAALPARVSYWLNLIGSALVIDTACSSSLMAIHLACQSIKSGESTVALAGGVFVSPGPQEQIASSAAGMLSQDGSCKSFSDTANGIAIGEGVGVVMLKSLTQAMADGDPIHAVIKATGANQDGKTNGLTAPNAVSQGQLIRNVLQSASLSPADIHYIETHGTGTKLGDPVEMEGLAQAFDNMPRDILLGSIKPNIGHCYAAAGIASFMKAVMAVKHGEIPPSIHAAPHNKLIDFEQLPFKVNTELRQWPTCVTRRAGISAFGYSGTNVHIVIESAPPQKHFLPLADKQSLLLPLSARSADCLKQQANALANYLLEFPAVDLNAFSHTLQVGRKALDYRRCLIVNGVDDAIFQLQSLATKNEPISRIEKRSSRPAKETGAKHFAAGSLQKFARLWEKGMEWNWENDKRLRLNLPGTALEMKRYWPEPVLPLAIDNMLSNRQVEDFTSTHSMPKINHHEKSNEIFFKELSRKDFKKIA